MQTTECELQQACPITTCRCFQLDLSFCVSLTSVSCFSSCCISIVHRLNDQVVILLKVPPSTLPVLHSLRIMQLGAVVQLKLDGPSNNLILTARKHVATSLDVVTDHLIVNKAVATIVKSEVRICKTSCALHCTHLDACVLRGSYG